MEVLLAMILLAVGVIGLLAVFAGSITQLRQARRHTMVAAYAQRRLDSLMSLPCATLQGSPTGARQSFESLSDIWTVSGSSDAPTVSVHITTPDAAAPIDFATSVACR